MNDQKQSPEQDDQLAQWEAWEKEQQAYYDALGQETDRLMRSIARQERDDAARAYYGPDRYGDYLCWKAGEEEE